MSDGARPGTHTVRIREGDQTRLVSMEKHEFVLGRDKGVDIPIENLGISRRHVSVRIAGFVVFVTDLGSANGTFVGGQEVKPGEEVVLPNGAEFGFGNIFVSVVPYVAPVIKRTPAAVAEEMVAAPVQSEPLRTKTQIDAIQAETVRVAEAILDEAKQNAAAIVNQARREAEQFREELRRDREGARGELEILKGTRERRIAAEAAYQEVESRRAASALAQSELDRDVTRLREEVASLEAAQRRLTQESEVRQVAAEAAFQKTFENTRALEERRIELELEIGSLVPENERLRADHAGLQEREKSVQDEVEHGERAVRELADQRDALAVQCASLDRRLAELKHQIEAAQGALAEEQGRRTDTETLIRTLDEQVRELQSKVDAGETAAEAQAVECRRQSALLNAQEAETRVKKLNLEAVIGELELKRIAGQRELELLLSQKAETLARVNGAVAEVASLRSQAQELHGEIEKTRRDFTQAQAQLAEQADLLAVRREVEGEIQRAKDQSVIDSRAARAKWEAELSAEQRSKKERLESEFAQKAQTMEREIAEAKLRELQIVGQMQSQEQAAARARSAYVLDEIIRTVVAIAERGPIDVAQIELRESVKAALEGRTVASRSAEGAERTRKFWKKAALRAAGPVAALFLLALFPGAPGAVRDGVMRGLASNKNDGGVFLEQILQRGLKYQPDLAQNYRETYAQNILYLEHYMELKLSEKEQREWTLALNNFIVGRLGLSDRVIPDFISAETVMIKELFRVREGILPQYLDQGLAHLQEAEKSESAKLIALLQGPENYAKFRSFEQSYYLDYLKRRSGQ